MPRNPLTKPSDAQSQSPETKSLYDRAKEHQASLITARDQLRLQLNGVENQLYILNQLLNPKPESELTPAPQPPEDTPGTI